MKKKKKKTSLRSTVVGQLFGAIFLTRGNTISEALTHMQPLLLDSEPERLLRSSALF